MLHVGRLPLALAGLALLLLAPLAWLQYSWIDRLAQAETSRLQSHLQASCDGFQRDLNQQIAQAVSSLVVHARPGIGPVEFAAALRASVSEGPAAALITSVYAAIRRPGGALALYNLGVGGEFGPAPWTEPLRPARAAAEEAMSSGEGAPPGAPLHIIDNVILLPHGPMVTRLAAGERLGPPPLGMGMGMRMGMGRPPWMMGPPAEGLPPIAAGRECWLVVLAPDRLRAQVFPELKQRWFPSGDEIDYQVAVEQKGAREGLLYVSDASLPPDFFRHPDAQRPLLGNPYTPGPWVLKVRHRGLGLDQAVVDGRYRNLALSFGVLFVLALSLVAAGVAARRAGKLAQAQMEFAAGVSHELRTPLSVIVSAGDNLAAGSVAAPEQVKKYGAVIRDEGRRLTRMVEHVLGFARLSRGGANLHFTSVPVEPVVQRALDICRPDIQAARVELSVQIPSGIPAVRGDEASLIQCTRNLVENALTHGGAGGWVGVSALARDGVVDIIVEDRGPGLDHDERRRIFDPFTRGRRAQAEQRRGSGLGLALVKRLAEAHGGSVRAEPATVPPGARFVLTLPAARVES